MVDDDQYQLQSVSRAKISAADQTKGEGQVVTGGQSQMENKHEANMVDQNNQSQQDIRVKKKTKKKASNLTLADFISFKIKHKKENVVKVDGNNRNKEKTEESFNSSDMKSTSTDNTNIKIEFFKCSNIFSVLETSDNEEEDTFEAIKDTTKMIKEKSLKMTTRKIRKEMENAGKKIKSKRSESSGYTFPNAWSRCGECFTSTTKFKHLPSSKFCRWMLQKKKAKKQKEMKPERKLTGDEKDLIDQHIAFLDQVKGSKASFLIEVTGNQHISKDNFWPYRLRGGMDEGQKIANIAKSLQTVKESNLPMIERAIANAASHGINLYPGVRNLANGNCAFESIIDSINTRSCFGETLDQSPNYYRAMWMGEVEKIAYQEWNGGLSKQEWKSNWEVLKQPGMYELELGDLIVPGIAHCTNKDILIFNTSREAQDPIYVISAAIFGGSSNTDIPVCLAYNQYHYESLVPCSEDDIQKTINLKEQFSNGEYNLRVEDIPALQDKTDEEFTNKDLSKESRDNYDQEYPSLIPDRQTRKKKQEYSKNNVEECTKTLEELRKIPAKQRTPNQIKRFHQLTYQQRKLKVLKSASTKSMSEPVVENIEQNEIINNRKKAVRDMSDEERKAYQREQYQSRISKKSQHDMDLEREKRKLNKSNERNKKKKQDPETFKKTQADKKANEREKKRMKNEEIFKKSIASEKANQRESERNEDEERYKEKQSSEKASQREMKRMKNEEIFKKTRASETANVREKKRMKNEEIFKKTRATEKAYQLYRKYRQ